MELSEILESIKNIALYIAIAMYLIFKILKYFISRDKLKLKNDSLSVFNSIESSHSLNVKSLEKEDK